MSNIKWEIDRVSTPDRIFQKINAEMVHPIGILIFGADCDFKNQVTDEFTANIDHNVFGFSYETSILKCKFLLKSEMNLIIVLNSDDSCCHLVRHSLVKSLQNFGAKTVVGVFVDPCGPLHESKAEAARQTLNETPPTADGLDYLIVVKEEER